MSLFLRCWRNSKYSLRLSPLRDIDAVIFFCIVLSLIQPNILFAFLTATTQWADVFIKLPMVMPRSSPWKITTNSDSCHNFYQSMYEWFTTFPVFIALVFPVDNSLPLICQIYSHVEYLSNHHHPVTSMGIGFCHLMYWNFSFMYIIHSSGQWVAWQALTNFCSIWCFLFLFMSPIFCTDFPF